MTRSIFFDSFRRTALALVDSLRKNRVVFLYGTAGSGKTTLISHMLANNMFSEISNKPMYLNAAFASSLPDTIHTADLLIIDDADALTKRSASEVFRKKDFQHILIIGRDITKLKFIAKADSSIIEMPSLSRDECHALAIQLLYDDSHSNQPLSQRELDSICELSKGNIVLLRLLLSACTKTDLRQLILQVSNLENSSIDQQSSALLAYLQGNLEEKKGNYEEALRFYLFACEAGEDSDRMMLGRFYSSAASVLKELCRYDEAISYYDRAILYSHDDLQLASLYNDLANLFSIIGDMDKARETYLKSIALFEAENDEIGLSSSYNNLATLLSDIGNNEEALSYFLKSISIREKLFSDKHEATALAYLNIACLYRNLKQYGQAFDYAHKAIRILEKEHNPSHLAAAYSNISSIYRSLSDYNSSLTFARKALEIWRNILPDGHPTLATAYNNLAITLYHLQEYAKSAEYMRKAYAILCTSFDTNHPHAQQVKASLSALESLIATHNG